MEFILYENCTRNLNQFIQKMKDYELYWGELTQKSLDEGTFFEIDEDENSKKNV